MHSSNYDPPRSRSFSRSPTWVYFSGIPRQKRTSEATDMIGAALSAWNIPSDFKYTVERALEDDYRLISYENEIAERIFDRVALIKNLDSDSTTRIFTLPRKDRKKDYSEDKHPKKRTNPWIPVLEEKDKRQKCEGQEYRKSPQKASSNSNHRDQREHTHTHSSSRSQNSSRERPQTKSWEEDRRPSKTESTTSARQPESHTRTPRENTTLLSAVKKSSSTTMSGISLHNSEYKPQRNLEAMEISEGYVPLPPAEAVTPSEPEGTPLVFEVPLSLIRNLKINTPTHLISKNFDKLGKNLELREESLLLRTLFERYIPTPYFSRVHFLKLNQSSDTGLAFGIPTTDLIEMEIMRKGIPLGPSFNTITLKAGYFQSRFEREQASTLAKGKQEEPREKGTKRHHSDIEELQLLRDQVTSLSNMVESLKTLLPITKVYYKPKTSLHPPPEYAIDMSHPDSPYTDSEDRLENFYSGKFYNHHSQNKLPFSHEENFLSIQTDHVERVWIPGDEKDALERHLNNDEMSQDEEDDDDEEHPAFSPAKIALEPVIPLDPSPPPTTPELSPSNENSPISQPQTPIEGERHRKSSRDRTPSVRLQDGISQNSTGSSTSDKEKNAQTKATQKSSKPKT